MEGRHRIFSTGKGVEIKHKIKSLRFHLPQTQVNIKNERNQMKTQS